MYNYLILVYGNFTSYKNEYYYCFDLATRGGGKRGLGAEVTPRSSKEEKA